LKGKKVHTISLLNATGKPGGKKIMLEQELVVKTFRRTLPDRGRDGRGLVQFYAVEGGQRTIDIADIVDIR